MIRASNYKLLVSAIFSASILCGLASPSFAQDFDDSYKKATEGKDVVKNKLYPKDGKFELSGPNLGLILNQSYINTILVGGGVNYWFSENWGVGLDLSHGINSDKSERTCIENFYNDPNENLSDPCGPRDNVDAANAEAKAKNLPGVANYGPAYVPIREINNIIMLNAIWAPIYGKQLIFLSTTSYFDLYMEFGGGIAMSTYYPKSETLKNTHISRPYKYDDKTGKPLDQNSNPVEAGASADETNSYGIDGRPDPLANTNILLNVSVGQKFHFGSLIHMKIYLRDMLLLGTQSGFENLLSLHVGMGFRF